MGKATNRKGTPGYENWMRKTAEHRAQVRDEQLANTYFAAMLDEHLRVAAEALKPGELIDPQAVLEMLCAIAEIDAELCTRLGLVLPPDPDEYEPIEPE